jgi:hypothetical protein
LDRRLRLRPLPPRGAAATASSGAKASAVADTSAPASSGGLDFDDVPLKDVIEYLRQRSGLSFHVNWRAMAISGIDRETAIELKARNITLARTLDLLTDQLSATRDRETSVYWLVENGVVSISTGAALNTGIRVRVIDVADVLLIVPNFKGPRINFEQQDQNQSGRDGLGGGGGEGLFDEDGRGGGARGDEDDEEESRKEMRERTRNALIKVVKDSIGEEMWTPTGKGNVQFLGNKLIISQTKLGFLLLKKAGILH